jgi:preprotein translocase subunit SecG
MSTILLLLHMLIAIGLVGVVLLQRSEGGGLGIGGGGSSFMTGRGTANFLTRATAALAAAFFLTSIGLTLLARQGARPVSPLDAPVSGPATPGGEAPKGGVLDSLEKGKQRLPKSE